MERTEVTRYEARHSSLLWFGVLAAPTAWTVQLLLDFGLEAHVVCAPGSGPGTRFLDLEIESVIQIINTAALAVAVLALIVSFRCWRSARSADPTAAGSATWMAVAGMFVTAVFLPVIALKFVPPLFLDPCTSPL